MLLVAALCQVNFLEREGFDVSFGLPVSSLEFPGGDVAEVFVVASGLIFRGLVFLAEVTAAGFVAGESVLREEFTEFEEVGNPSGVFEILVERVARAENLDAVPEFVAEIADFLDGGLKTSGVAGHAAVVPESEPEFSMETVGSASAVNIEDGFETGARILDDVGEGGMIGGDGGEFTGGQVVAEGVGDDEVTVGESLHQGAGPEAIGTVVGEVGFTEDVESGNGALEVVVDPESPHGVVDGGVDPHGNLVGVLVGDLVVHMEEVSIFLFDDVESVAFDGLCEVEVDGGPGFPNPLSGVAAFLGISGGDVAGNHVAEGRVLAFEVVVPFLFGDLIGGPRISFFEGDPNATVVAETFAHQCELGLVVAGDGDASGVDLGVAGVGEESPPFVGAPGGGDVAALGIGREVIGIAVTAGAEEYGVSGESFKFSRDHVAEDDASGDAVDGDDVHHLATGVERDFPEFDLPHETAVGTEEQLLSGLAAGVESPGDLRSPEGAIGECAAVFPGEGDPLGDALIDDGRADLGESVDVGFPSAEVSPLDGVVEETVDAVSVVLVVLGGVDASLSGNAVCAAGRVVEGDGVDLVAEFGKGGGSGGTGESGSDDDDGVFSLVGRGDQLEVELVSVPARGHRTAGDVRLEE